MAQLSSQLIIMLTDGVTGPAKRVVGSLRGVTAAARTSTVAAVRSMNRMTSAVTAGVGAMGIYKAHETIKQFATATNKLSAANPDFGLDQIKEVARLAREVSRQSLFDPATVMEAANSLARADVSLDAIKGTLKPLATAAMAADVSINELSDDFVKLASNFGMSLKTSKDAAKTFAYLGDLAVYVGQKAPGTFGDFVGAMKQVGAAARTAGIDIKWLAGAYIALDKAGIRNQEAGTALRSMVKHLTQPTLEARKMYGQLGIDPSTFLKSGKKVNADQMIAAFQSEYGKDLTRVGPRLQEVIASKLTSKDKGNALFKIIQRAWGGRLRPVDARKIKKTVDNFMFSATETIDPQAWMDQLEKKGVTLGQFLRLVEPRQASRLINLLKQEHGDDGANEKLKTPLSALPGFRDGLADEAGAKMMQGYPAAIKKVSDAFQSLIERLDEAGAIDGFAKALTFLGEAVVKISNGSAGFTEWAAGLVLVAPALKMLTPLFTAFGIAAGGAAKGLTALTGIKMAGSGAAAGVGLMAVMKNDAETGNNLRTFLRNLFGISDPNEPAPWTPGGDWNKSPQAKINEAFQDLKPNSGTGTGTVGSPQHSPIQHLNMAGPAGAAGDQTGDAFRSHLAGQLNAALADMHKFAQQAAQILSFSASPSITPKFGPLPTAPKSGQMPATGLKVGSAHAIKDQQHAMFADYGFNTA
jgi:hypothetical protein